MGDVMHLNAHCTGDPLQWRRHSLTGDGLGRRWRPAAALVDGARRWARASVAPSGAAVWWRPSRALSVWRRFGKGALGCYGSDVGSTIVGAMGVGREEFWVCGAGVGGRVFGVLLWPMILLLAAHTWVLLRRHLHSCPVQATPTLSRSSNFCRHFFCQQRNTD